ncbi:class I SAM-dependent methyltransferase [Spirosoma aerolatum]|uniref:class I SAM-dependent methyltransferase n=1 Tax=Spirosoma aerolatum TaxID=1211326 RepID=UPI0009AF0485|nr:methyltransferase domain-containing protein [Spirosoma aerolatum]
MEYVWDMLNTKTYNNPYGRYKFAKQYSFILSQFDNRKNILDIAGGSGRYAIPLFSETKDITVVDINKYALELLKNREPEIYSIEGDFMEVSLPNKYSLILCIEALSYFRNYNLFFKKINTLLDENGTFVFLMVNPQSWRYTLRRFNKGRTDYGEISYENIKLILKKNNLKIKSVKGFNWMPFPLSMSNALLIKTFSFLEHLLGFEKWISQSPWLLVSVTKDSNS